MKRARKQSLAVIAAIGTAFAMAPGTAMGASADRSGADRIVPVVSGLNGPRGLVSGPPRRLLYAEADGSISQTVLHGNGAGTTLLGTIDGVEGLAPSVSQVTPAMAYILTPGGEPGSGANTLYMWMRETGDITPVADIAAYQATDPDPYNQEGEPTESNPYGVAALADGSALVADAAGNDLLHVSPDGSIETVARIKPRTVLVPKALEGQPGVPPPGTPIDAEGVATSVTIGTDGAYYLGELRGFPATPHTSEIWRIEPGSVDAVCDPEKPNTGDCTRYADGLTSIVDLASAPDGSIYAVELVKKSWLQWELGIADPPIGGVYRIASSGAEPDLISSNRLILPGGIDVTKKGKIFVSTPIVSESGDDGQIVRVR